MADNREQVQFFTDIVGNNAASLTDEKKDHILQKILQFAARPSVRAKVCIVEPCFENDTLILGAIVGDSVYFVGLFHDTLIIMDIHDIKPEVIVLLEQHELFYTV